MDSNEFIKPETTRIVIGCVLVISAIIAAIAKGIAPSWTEDRIKEYLLVLSILGALVFVIFKSSGCGKSRTPERPPYIDEILRPLPPVKR
jgi:hypothetical protein